MVEYMCVRVCACGTRETKREGGSERECAGVWKERYVRINFRLQRIDQKKTSALRYERVMCWRSWPSWGRRRRKRTRHNKTETKEEEKKTKKTKEDCNVTAKYDCNHTRLSITPATTAHIACIVEPIINHKTRLPARMCTDFCPFLHVYPFPSSTIEVIFKFFET